jgi:hypothetical protein
LMRQNIQQRHMALNQLLDNIGQKVLWWRDLEA